jgi:enoyl-CoA hydratase/carnithine racemase
LSLVRLEERGPVLLVTLDRPPANAFHTQLVAELRKAFREAAGAGAVVLASALPGLFSAGWDLPTLVGYGRKEMAVFYEAFCDLVREIFVFGAPVVAALPGHAIAGGLILAAAADERYAAEGKGEFGLSEVKLALPVPSCCLEVFRHGISSRAAERLAATGENLSAAAAKTAGLLDRVVPAGELLGFSGERAAELALPSPAAHAAIKRCARSSALARFDRARQKDPFLGFWFGKDAQLRIRALVEKLRKKK